ncbi:MAG: transposase, partial [Deltaproteobacteria bacterium]|nr:transposase [Deltaproteobacteria bacterium]
ETVLRWHRKGYELYWRWRSRGKTGRPRIPRQHIEFIRRISSDHPEWGEDRIALELKLKLGAEHDPSTVRRYMVDGDRPGHSTWGRFLSSHASQMWALDFTTQVMWNFNVCYILVILALDSRRVVHVSVTASPTLAWLKQQLRDATPWGTVPRFLLHDNDGVFGQFRASDRSSEPRNGKRYRCALDLWLAVVLGAKGVSIPYGAPNASANVERFMRTLKEECLRHFIFFSEAQLRRTVVEFVGYANEARPHQGITNIPDIAAGRLPARQPGPVDGRLVARPILGGLAHDYSLAA